MNIRLPFLLTAMAAAVTAGIWWVESARHAPVSSLGQTAAPQSPAPARADARPTLAEDIVQRLREAAARHGDAREAFLQQAVRGIPRALYASLAQGLAKAPPRSVEAEILRAILLRWAWEEPMNAADWAIEHTDYPYRKEALAFAAQGWAKRDPAQLLEWSADLSPADREWVLLRSGDYLGRADPALFAVWHNAIPAGREREQLLLAISREWAQRDPEKLLASLAENTGPEFEEWRRLTIAGLTTRLTTMDGLEAAQFVTEKIPPGPDQTRAALAAVVAWARQDPAAASHWINRFQTEELRTQAAQVLLGYWLQKDPIAAQAYARSLPAGSTADGAHERVAQFLSETSRQDAIAWAQHIADPERRQRTLAFVATAGSRPPP